MWIPNPVYEALPYFYMLFGAVFIAGTFYIGFSAPGAMIYIGAGIFSGIYGAVIFARRQAFRRRSEPEVPIETPELAYRQ